MTNNTYFNRNEITESNSKKEDSTLNKEKVLTPQLFTFCKYSDQFDNKPIPISNTWLEFCDLFKTHRKRNTKNGNCWSPCRYVTGTTRGNQNVAEICMAVIDIDNGVPLESLIEKINGYTYLIHSSYSHTQEKPKYRAILPLVKPIENTEWPETWLRINAWLGSINDPSTKDSSRLYFMPSCPLDSKEHFVKIGNGKLLNVCDLPELPVTVSKSASHKKNLQRLKHIDGIDGESDDDLGSEDQLKAMQQRCNFIQFVAKPENQPLVSEPLWMAMLSNQCRFEGGVKAAHDASCHHLEYDENATDRKLERCLSGSAPITCQRIIELGFKECPSGGCKLPSGVATKSPAGLGVWANKRNKTVEGNSAIPAELHGYLNEYHRAGLIFVSGSFYGYKDG